MLLSEFSKQNDASLYRYVDSGMFHYYENSAGEKIFDNAKFEKGRAEGKYKEALIDMDDFVPENSEPCLY